MSTVGRSASAASIVRSIAGWLIETIGGWPRRPASSLMNSTARPSEVRMLRAGHHLRVRQDRGVEAHGLEDPQDLVVDDGGARQVVGLVLAVEGQRAEP